MPRLVPQSLKSLSTIKMQPERVTPKMEVIMCMDIAGRSGKEIAAELGLGESRISIIRNSPLYLNRMKSLRADVENRFMDKHTDKLTSGDPVEEALKKAALGAAEKKVELMKSGDSQFIQSAAAGDILDRAGYKSYTEKTKVTVEVTEKMADRFDKALRYEPSASRTKIRIETTE